MGFFSYFNKTKTSPSAVSTGGGGGGGTLLFNGDYSTGNFNQWQNVQNKSYNDNASGWTGSSYPLTLVTDPVKGPNTARMEVRSGDVMAGGERSEVRGGFDAAGGETTRWYKWSTKFDAGYRTTWGTGEWAVTNQWHVNDSLADSPPISMGYVGWSGHIGSLELLSKAADQPNNWAIWHAPIAVGTWHEIVLQIKWTEDTDGFITLKYNGVQQTFNDFDATGTTTWVGRTNVSGGDAQGVYYKEGLYRSATASTGIVYHTGFRIATTEAALGS